MIDIHTHIIPFIDDGSQSLLQSEEMLKAEHIAGVTDIICTPHYRADFYENTPNVIADNYKKLLEIAKKYEINLHLGEEITVIKSISQQLNEGMFLTLAGSKYTLLEFDYNNYTDICEIVYSMVLAGYIPVIAHVERYTYFSDSDIKEAVNLGALIQINSASLVGVSSRKYLHRLVKLIKNDLVHFCASDYHYTSSFSLLEAYNLVLKIFGKNKADDLFINNAKKIIKK